ncbi:MAG: hypothetical protein A3I77_06615 [Gammaproteobacteria bacterium RIFCSPLOWO2_02_FULL_42_14]|nr:MAG: hypothetical protein A3B71_07305 [Gammaproteobacteria bacterium RIFCSPHIGHO2_02_FULL_42_43]OGT52781.1 MAG: hypothetical protein A3E54_08675 [Gammaproteobacteria bacterium RIFCSPHIGHO2_12_FULL_41_25]OGT63316.1 MAG: hypothetical protein A3I77_06615 [Gammaproteobacteria bacterium RIFCSPLOWO2_02_FULL_42_14]OGT86904.1 MAG: hypothetical protein A3G86_05875 [Gammaproteobacteria bacterium RIFCSPLOWO2_12_FULL_42_18]
MSHEEFEWIERVNYWSVSPKQSSYVRTNYVTVIMHYFGSSVIKVLIGQRRCGKSTILKQIIIQLLENNTPKQNILFLNFELHELQWIKTQAHLIHAIETYFKKLKPAGKVYIFLDEIQEVDQWEKAINSFLANDRYDIEFVLTGSNANLLSTELSTYVTGRYVEIPIFPFSFKEYTDYHKLSASRESLIQYLESSGLPELFSLPERTQKISYLGALKDSIVMNDIVRRFQVKNPKLLMLLLDFLIDNAGKLFSLDNIAKKLKSSGMVINLITLSNYVYYLELTFLIHAAHRYDLKGKKILEGERKYYLNDLGFSNYLQNTFENNITRRLENFVYMTLVQAGFRVFVGNWHQLEIDFIAEKNNQIVYVQVTYLLMSDEIIAREYGNLEKIKDNWPKWVVSLDEMALPTKEGIRHVQAWDFSKSLFKISGLK